MPNRRLLDAKLSLPVVAALVAGSVLGTAALLRPPQAQAQSGVAEGLTAVAVTYGLKTFAPEMSVMSSPQSEWQDILPIPDTPIFLIQNKSNLYVVQVTEKGLNEMRQIRLAEDFQRVVLLGDGVSFIVRNKKTATVYSITKDMKVIKQPPTAK